MLDYAAIGSTIRKVRKSKKLTQEQLAERVDISSYHLRNIESANARIGLTTLVKIANELDISTDEILESSLANKKKAVQSEYYELIENCNEQQLRIISNVIKTLVKYI